MTKKKHPLSFETFTDTDLYTILAKKGCSLDDEKISEVNFIFWFVYYVERKLKDSISNPVLTYIKSKGFSGDLNTVSNYIDSCMDELTFTSKINVYQAIMKGTKFEPKVKKYVNFCRELNTIRNQISHNKVEVLLYKNRPIKNRTTKEEMIRNFYDSMGS
jgi:hypothetical protein